MPVSTIHPLDKAENCDFVHGLLERRLSRGGLAVPLLPEVAIRVMRLGADPEADAAELAALISADAAITMAVLRMASSAANRPAVPIVSLHQAVAWLGFEETVHVAFALALQGKLMNIPGHSRTARRLWRHSLASALWSKRLAELTGQDAGQSYLCGLLHEVGKPVTLAALHDIVQRAQVKLSPQEYERLIETFHRAVGMQVAASWDLPPAVRAALAHWEAYAAAGDARRQCAVVNLAHRLAERSLSGSFAHARDEIAAAAAGAEIGLAEDQVDALLGGSAGIHADLESYFPA